MVRTQIQLTEEQARALKELALSQRTSMAELIRQSVDELLRREAGADAAERRRRAIDAAGRYRSGRSDVAGRHDDYLAEAYRE